MVNLDAHPARPPNRLLQVFAVFSELVAGACRQADEGDSSDTGSGRCGKARVAGRGKEAGGRRGWLSQQISRTSDTSSVRLRLTAACHCRSRMEDELMIFVRKQLSSAQGAHRRIGIIGTVALVQRLGAATSDALESESAIGGWRGVGGRWVGWSGIGGATQGLVLVGCMWQARVCQCAAVPAQPVPAWSCRPLLRRLPYCLLWGAGKRYREAMGALKDTFASCQRRWVGSGWAYCGVVLWRPALHA